MAHAEHDHLVDQVPHFLNVPTDWLDDFGRIALLAGRIELVAYQIAEGLGLPRPKNGRTRPFSTECSAIHARIDDPWLPPEIAALLSGTWRTRTAEWASSAPRIMDEHRNGVLHRHYASQSDGTRWHPVFVTDNRDLSKLERYTERDLFESIEVLRPLAREGFELLLALPNGPHVRPDADTYRVELSQDASGVDGIYYRRNPSPQSKAE